MIFYTQLFMSKRGPLAKIWLAAHWERKLTKAHVFECNLENTVRDIISPKIKIGLRTSGHLLLGVVRIYSRKAKYLLADCSDAVIKIKGAFRPDQTDMPAEELEATFKAITLIEDFTDFDTQPLQPSNIDDVDHLTLNQSRTEEITLKEDFGNSFLTLVDLGSETLCPQSNILDMSFQSMVRHEDTFGDENRGFDLLDFLTNFCDPAESTDFILMEPQNEKSETLSSHQSAASRMDHRNAESPTLNESTLIADEEEAFALEPVAATPTLDRKKGKRKRKLVVDQTKELTNEAIRDQLDDFSDVVAPLDIAPPTRLLMQWKEKGGVQTLFGQLCSTAIAPHINELFAKNIFLGKNYVDGEEVEEFRHFRQEVQRDRSGLTTGNLSVVDSSMVSEKTHSADQTVLDHINDNQPEDLSELEQSWSSSDCMFSLQALCERSTRSQAADTFFCLLVLKKQQALHMHQSAPYEDIFVTPGPKFYDM
ncbi:hypothetical protein LDENG_00269880 [Lucifuga dentata]|nr:hypothetical protein LDENG_00269880 [Lucifuga dentata]